MNRVLELSIDPSHISADAALICCIDPRWWNKIGGNTTSIMDAFVAMKGWNKFVPLTVAGGIKVLVSEDAADTAAKESLLARIDQEISLHHPGVLALSVHRDCGGYGYSAAFGNDAEKESERLYKDLSAAKRLLSERLGPGVALELYVFDEKGVEQVSS